MSVRPLHDEVLLYSKYERKAILPIQYHDIWALYKKAQGSIWTAEEIEFKEDLAHWEVLDENTKTVVKTVLAFFSGADAIVNDNLAENFLCKIVIPEVKCFYRFQLHIEDVHNEVYSLMIDNLIKDPAEKTHLLDAIHTMPGVKKLYTWAQKWIHVTAQDEIDNCDQLHPKCVSECCSKVVVSDLAEIWCISKQLVAFACVEGIMFSGAFAIIYWLKEKGILPGLTFSNELISRDEGLHMRFACHLYSMISNKPPTDQITQIVKEATELSQELIAGCMTRLTGMNSTDMNHYIEFVANKLHMDLGYEPIYSSKNPFDFMEKTAINGMTNFFEKRVGEYSKAGFEKGHNDEIVIGDEY